MGKTAGYYVNCGKVSEIIRLLDSNYPQEISFLKFENSFQLLISVILSAQTTDRQVMQVVPALFKAYPDPEAMSVAEPEKVMEIIRPVGFFRVKAHNIIKTSEILLKEYRGVVPDTMEKLVRLPGVGRKSANVIIGTVFEKPAVIVDTHFGRVVRRLGLTDEKNPDKIEKKISEIIPEAVQYRFSMTANLHGRKTCHARKPECGNCFLNHLCSSVVL
jgi:endonuclease-3